MGRRGLTLAATNSVRTGARDKLTRLSQAQFSELAVDVGDEAARRTAGALQPLQPRPEFHQRRNQARQKLAALPEGRLKDLVSDVVYEWDRRNIPGQAITVNPVYPPNQSVSARSFDALGLSSMTPAMTPAMTIQPPPGQAQAMAALAAENIKLKTEYDARLNTLYGDTAGLKQDFERRLADGKQEAQNQINMLMNDVQVR